jgi:hypothetical protein
MSIDHPKLIYYVYCVLSIIDSYQSSSKNQTLQLKVIFKDFTLDEHTFVVAIVTSNVW